MRFALPASVCLVALAAAPPALAETPVSTACIIAAGQKLLPGLSVQSAVQVKAARFEAKDKGAVADALSGDLYADRNIATILSGFGPLTAGIAEEIRSGIATGQYSQAKTAVSRFISKNAAEAGIVTFDVVAFGQPATFTSHCASAPGAVYAQPPILR